MRRQTRRPDSGNHTSDHWKDPMISAHMIRRPGGTDRSCCWTRSTRRPTASSRWATTTSRCTGRRTGTRRGQSTTTTIRATSGLQAWADWPRPRRHGMTIWTGCGTLIADTHPGTDCTCGTNPARLCCPRNSSTSQTRSHTTPCTKWTKKTKKYWKKTNKKIYNSKLIGLRSKPLLHTLTYTYIEETVYKIFRHGRQEVF